MINITVGLARLFPVAAVMSAGPDSGVIATVATNASARVKVLMNPSNNRELGVLALTAGSPSDVVVTIGTKQATFQVQTLAPTIESVSVGTDGGEITPPAWLLNG